jgi:hypothetical protein
MKGVGGGGDSKNWDKKVDCSGERDLVKIHRL